jgi:CheY-like chemotaxis protein
MTRNRKILLVDDHETILMILERMLEQPCVSFLRAGSGDEALAVAREERPDVILLDVCMPGMDGLEVCEEIKNDPQLANTRVILMSAVIGENGLRESCDELRADGYLGKPFDPEAVRRGVAAMLFMARGEVPEH